jgi:aspartyl-tRNA(Asn)/glutamyl-tRNA(Gln) amidotransferase subunit C
MNIDEETVNKIAHLARLELSAEEKAETIKDMNRILGFMDKLNEVDTSAVEPLIYMSAEINVLRDDVVKQEITHEEALLNAPEKDQDFFHVAKVISH